MSEIFQEYAFRLSAISWCLRGDYHKAMIALLENQDETLHGFSLKDAKELKKRFNQLYESVIVLHEELAELEIVQEPNDLIREFAFDWDRIAEIEKELLLFIQRRAL